jgi:hypothetical protein
MPKQKLDGPQSACRTQLPSDEDFPFPSPWMFGKDSQEVLLNCMSGHLQTRSPNVAKDHREHQLQLWVSVARPPSCERESLAAKGVGSYDNSKCASKTSLTAE